MKYILIELATKAREVVNSDLTTDEELDINIPEANMAIIFIENFDLKNTYLEFAQLIQAINTLLEILSEKEADSIRKNISTYFDSMLHNAIYGPASSNS